MKINFQTIRLRACLLGVAGLLLVAVPAAFADDASSGTFCPEITLDENATVPAGCENAPQFRSSFINRIWRFQGDVSEVSGGANPRVEFTLGRIDQLPRKFRSQDDELIDQDTYALFSITTRVYDTHGHLVSPEKLADADAVEVRGRLLPPKRWEINEDGYAVPTIRAKRIYITESGASSQDTAGRDSSGSDGACKPGYTSAAGTCTSQQAGGESYPALEGSGWRYSGTVSKVDAAGLVTITVRETTSDVNPQWQLDRAITFRIGNGTKLSGPDTDGDGQVTLADIQPGANASALTVAFSGGLDSSQPVPTLALAVTPAS